jgi:large subunit ribosomal protein L17
VFRYLQNKFAVTELFREIAPKVADRPGGYTRIIKTGNRLGDNAETCLIELVDFNDLLLTGKDAKKAKTTRRGRRAGGKSTTAKSAAGADVATEASADVSEESSSTKAEKTPAKPKRGRKKAEGKKGEE